ncbi:MAG TPA: response regulator, partial [Pirellulales bacterium]|nr:response regulator [Pirellulales bacterium]
LLALEATLESLGQNLVTASSGGDALRLLLDREFSVILLDINMPGMDGFETASLIRQHPRCAQTPIIFVTAYADDMMANHGYSLGAVDFVLSPVLPDVLRTKVGVFVDLYKKSQQIKRNAEAQIALAHEQAARAVAEDASRRSQFLAEASTVLAQALTSDRSLLGLTRHAVPFLADACVVSLADDAGRVREHSISWQEPGREQESATFATQPPLPAELVSAIERVAAGNCADAAVTFQSCSQPQAAVWPAALAPQSSLVLPLRAHGRTFGSLSLVLGPDRKCYRSADVALAHDLADRAATALENARLYQDIQDSDRRKNEFLAMLAHELRNPLAPIRNAVEILHEQEVEQPKLRWVHEVIDRQVQQLVRLVDDLLDISRITRGNITLQKETVNLCDMLARAVEMSRPLIDARQHKLECQWPEEQVLSRGDPARLTQAVSNLLNNSAKFTADGGRIWLSLEHHSTTAVIRVRDSGIGIPESMLGRVFELFAQVDCSLDRSQGGLGLGLTLVRTLIEMHEGTVEAFSSGPNQGCEFVITLPAIENANLREPPVPATHTPRLASHKRVLVVDDNIDAATTISTLLRLRGCETQVYGDGFSALKHAEEFHPDLVLLDIGLPGMDGYEVARCFRQSSGLRNAVLAALTGYGRDEDQRQSREAGFDHHLVKPISISQLDALLACLDPALCNETV